MSKVFFLIILFLIIFIVQQSNLIEAKKVMDARLGVATEEFHLNWDNLQKYLDNIPKETKKIFSKKPHHR